MKTSASLASASIKSLMTPKSFLAALAAGSLLLSGCFRDESSSTGNGPIMTASVEGHVEGDAGIGMGKRSSMAGGVEGAVVTVARIKTDGSFETVSTAEARTDVKGHFVVRTAVPALDGARELVVTAKKDGKEWKAVVSGKVKQGAVIACRPLNLESSIEADVLAKVRAESDAAEVPFADIASHIDAGLSLQAESKGETKAQTETWFAAGIKAEAKARTAVLVSSTGKATLAQIGKAHEARMDAQARLEADLEAAFAASGDISAEMKAKIETERHDAEVKAWTEAGITLKTLSLACDSSYKAAVQTGNSLAIDAETRLAWLHKAAFESAVTLEASAKEEAKASSGNQEIVIASGTVLKASLLAAKTEGEIDAAFTAFRASITVLIHGFSLSGKVEGGASGADVQVATVKADGSLEILTHVSGKTDAQGGFTLNTDAKLPDSILVIVTKGESKLMILIDSATHKPLEVGTETTVEADIVRQLLKDGKAAIVTREEIKAQVDSGTAAQVKGDDSAMAHLKTAIEIAAQAKAKFLSDAGAEVSASLEGKACSLELYAQTLARFAVGLSAEAGFSAAKSAHVQAAATLRAAAEAKVKAAGASELTIKSLESAGASFQASLQAAVNAEAIASAYASYHASVTASLKAALVLHAAAVEKIDASIRAADGARAELIAKLKAAADAAACSKAHAEFSASVEAQVESSFKGGLGAPSEAQVKAVASALVLANMGG